MAEFRIFCSIGGIPRDARLICGVPGICSVPAVMMFSADPTFMTLRPGDSVTQDLPCDIKELSIVLDDTRMFRFVPCDSGVFVEQWAEIKRLREENEELRAQIKVAA